VTLIELTFTAGVAVTAAAAATPQLLVAVDDSQTLGAARYVSSRLQLARMEAITRSANVAMQFTSTNATYTFTVYEDGNGNGVLSRDIQRGTDPEVRRGERLPDQFSGVDFGAVPELPAVDPSGTAPGTDPIKLGSSDMVSFSPLGTSTSGSLYVRGRKNAQYAVRIYGETGKTRVLRFDGRNRVWKPL
jgi:type II secretory pathway pseudopilin PulG